MGRRKSECDVPRPTDVTCLDRRMWCASTDGYDVPLRTDTVCLYRRADGLKGVSDYVQGGCLAWSLL